MYGREKHLIAQRNCYTSSNYAVQGPGGNFRELYEAFILFLARVELIDIPASATTYLEMHVLLINLWEHTGCLYWLLIMRYMPTSSMYGLENALSLVVRP